MTKTKRWVDAIIIGAVGVGVFAWGASGWSQNKFPALVIMLIGAGAIGFAWFGCYSGACPDCGKNISLDGAGGLTKCPHCRRYTRASSEGIARLPADFVADQTVFAIPFADGLVLPDACSVCLKPPTRRTTLEVKMEDRRGYKTMGEGLKKNAMIGAGVIPTIQVKVTVPHCDQHAHDARIDMAEGEVAVFVRSYAYYRAATGLN